ncbi:cytochrome-c peroxidase [Ferrovibrio sp.]|uniref:cytochrome-c peroxidase n=1 Tax=Ferrovibrio sp. TaxID=1917215 RepID=UPI003511216E
MIRLLPLLVVLLAAPAAAVEFTPAERAQIERLGPWPPAFTPDPGNRLSGQPAAIAFGAALFTEPRLSAAGDMSCASCHRPEQGWGDGRALAKGRQGDLVRHTPGLWNARLLRWFGWDGASDSLWAAAIRPVLSAAEMGGSAAQTAAVIRGDDALSRCFAAAAGQEADALADEEVLVLAAKALAAFQETIVSARAPFDEFRDALLQGRASEYPEDARRGLTLFLGRGNCVMCHAGPAFTNGEFHDTGLPFFTASGRPDPGRFEGIRQVRESPWNRLSRHSDDASGTSAFAVRHAERQHRNWGEFKTPSLRNLAHTAPYMHNGSLPTQAAVIGHYSDLDPDRLHSDGEAILRAQHFSPREAADLAAFLASLSAPADARGGGWLERAGKCGTGE